MSISHSPSGVRPAVQKGRHCALLALMFAAVAFVCVPQASAQACSPKGPNPSVTVCTPTVNSIATISPVHVTAASTDTVSVTTMQVYVDNKLVFQVGANAVDTFIPLVTGNHLLTVQAWDNSGATFKTNVPMAMTPPCKLKTTNRTVAICTPGAAATVSLPVHLVAGVNDSNPLTSIQVLADGKQVFSTTSGNLDVYLPNLTAASHTLAVKATDATGSFSSSVKVNVTNNAGLSNIRHIIFFVQENRSFDNYFGRLGAYRVSKGLSNNVDGVPLNAVLKNTQGQPVSPFHFKTVCHENLSPFWNETHTDVDGGLMDGFMLSSTSVPSNIDPTGTRAMGYYDQRDLPFYYELARQFGTSDRFFSSVESNTNANRMYLFAGTSFGHIRPDTPPSGGWPQTTIFDKLDAAGVSWRYYNQDPGGAYLFEWSTFQRDSSKIVPISQWPNDLQNEATLPSVIFIERAGASGRDEHPGGNIQVGASNTELNIIRPLLNSPSWATSVFIQTYDEAGALYDHVVPASMMQPDSFPPMLQVGDKPGDFAHSGLRIPVMVISPWSKPNYVSHTWRDLTSILRLIETRFNIVSSLTGRDAAADNMMEFFDFTTPHWLTPPSLPTQPTNGVCSNSLERAPGY
jgi:phospholipase C